MPNGVVEPPKTIGSDFKMVVAKLLSEAPPNWSGWRYPLVVQNYFTPNFSLVTRLNLSKKKRKEEDDSAM